MKKILFTLFFLSLLSCTSTKIVSSWCEPNKQITINNLNKVLVVALFKSETTAHNAEDQMVGYLNGKGIQSYNYFTASFDKKNEEVIRQKIKADGFDGAITMRLIDVDKEKIYNPSEINYYPDVYRSFSGYYYSLWSYSKTPGYYTTTKKFIIETNVYSIKTDKIIWSSITETIDLDGVEKLTNEVAKVVYKQMVKEQFVK